MPAALVFQRHALWLADRFMAWSGLSRQVYFEQRIAEYRRMWERVAVDAGATFTPLAPDLWEIRSGTARTRIRNHELEFDDPVTLALAGRKPVVHALLRDAGLAVPEHLVFDLGSLQAAIDFAAAHPAGTVVKPAGGFGGRGVTTHVRGPVEVRRAALRAAVHDRELLIEPLIPGESYRLLVLEGQVVDAVWRRGPRVRGDGSSSVRTLLDGENAARQRGGQRTIDSDRDLVSTLAWQHLDLQAIPEAGREVVLKSMDRRSGRFANVRTVYTDRALDVVCASIRRDAETAARVVGSDFLGVDVITTDPSLPLAMTGGVINEVNTTPALHHHYDDRREPYPRVAPLILEALLRRHREAAAARAGSPAAREAA